MRIAFGWLALLLFFVSMVAHVAALLGVDVQEHVPLVWLLHVGVFVVALPAILVMRKWKDKSGNLASLLRGLPLWARAFIIGLGVYTILNFIVFFVTAAEGLPKEREHRYVLDYKGTVVRELTVEEFHSRRAHVVRGFSGHWLIFYFGCFAVLLLHREVPGGRDLARRTKDAWA